MSVSLLCLPRTTHSDLSTMLSTMANGVGCKGSISRCGNTLEIAERDNVLYRRFCIGQSGPYLCSHLGFFDIVGNVAGNFPLAQTANDLVFVAVSARI